MTLLIGSLQLGLIYGLLALGVYIAFRILSIPDLTADGSFTLGLAVSAVLTVAGHPILGIFAALVAGAVAGTITGLLQTKMKVHPILAGIITMTGLYSINLFIMGVSSNVSLIGNETIFSMGANASNITKTLIAAIISVIVFMILMWFFKTQLGLSIRATGNNEDMVRASSINVDRVKIIAIAISNSCVALSGAVLAQYQGFADISSGVGIMVIGLASVIIGEVFLGKRSVTLGFAAAIIGSIVYRFIIALALRSSIFPAYALKLVSAFIVAMALSIPVIKKNMQQRKIIREGRKSAKNY
ncbi:ABC transporter permease [Alkalibaculum bacchi]|uniref:ABC transporter permease n=1 Tax=Alkalibaculum bacchi TaxID=645887 RepID=UPI0026EDC133|nr:ABC transporter permease [Alkalibaculum bacchi]